VVALELLRCENVLILNTLTNTYPIYIYIAVLGLQNVKVSLTILFTRAIRL